MWRGVTWKWKVHFNSNPTWQRTKVFFSAAAKVLCMRSVLCMKLNANRRRFASLLRRLSEKHTEKEWPFCMPFTQAFWPVLVALHYVLWKLVSSSGEYQISMVARIWLQNHLVLQYLDIWDSDQAFFLVRQTYRRAFGASGVSFSKMARFGPKVVAHLMIDYLKSVLIENLTQILRLFGSLAKVQFDHHFIRGWH